MAVIALGLVAAAAAVVVLAYLLQRQLIYLPYGEVPPAATVLPGAQDVRFTTDDGVELAGWFLPAADEGPGPAVLVANGNAGNRSHRAPLARALAEAGAGVLLFDYRGYGANPGRPSEDGLRRDARAARDYLAGRAEVDPDRLVYYGESLGAAVMVTLAAEHPPAGLVLRSPFTSLADVGRLHYPWLPVDRLLRDRYESADTIARVEAPLLVVAGGDDGIVPPTQSRALYAAAAGPKRLVLVAGADHNDAALLAGDELVGEVTRFLAEVV